MSNIIKAGLINKRCGGLKCYIQLNQQHKDRQHLAHQWYLSGLERGQKPFYAGELENMTSNEKPCVNY